MQKNRPIVLSVAGFDPCGGAGVLADIKTFEQLKVQGMASITALTIQTEDSIHRLDWIDIKTIAQSIQTLMDRYEINVIKIGVVKDLGFLKTIVACIRNENSKAFIIWDPIIKSSSGYPFFKQGDEKLLPTIYDHIDLITPNYDEYNLLKPWTARKSSTAWLIKGGHRHDHIGLDVLINESKEESRFFPSTPKKVYPKHGSGCILSSAIAAQIALGNSLKESCREAKKYIEHYLNSHPTLLGYHNHVK